MAMYGFVVKMHFIIVHKLRKVGAVSLKTAVTPMEAGLNSQERQWLRYLAGGFLSTIKKTEDGRYYI